MTDIKNFNIRVYGLVINQENEILISTEQYRELLLQKFVGGGLEKGEGLKEGLEREFKEETNSEIHVGDLFYVNDFFQSSIFNESDQIISIYYSVSPKNWADFLHNLKTFSNQQTFTWHNIASIDPTTLSLPIDRIVIEKLKKLRT